MLGRRHPVRARGSDGTIGLRAIKEQGGLTVAQDDAEYDGMMRSAVRSGVVDFVLPLEKMPAKLDDYFRHLTSVEAAQGPDGLRPRSGRPSGADLRAAARAHRPRFQRLQGQDRGAPRAAAHAGAADRRGAPTSSSACASDPRELDALLQDLLIGVTNFFRDPQAFEALEREVDPAALRRQGTGRHGPRLGARLLDRRGGLFDRHAAARAHAERQRPRRKLQIFASDIDEQCAGDRAATAAIPSTIAEDVPPARLRALLRPRGRHLPHCQRPAGDAACSPRTTCCATPPFSKLDLVSCRNLLIYLDAGAAEPADPAVPLRAQRRRLPVPRHLGERRRAIRGCSATVDKAAAPLPAPARRSSAGCPSFR